MKKVKIIYDKSTADGFNPRDSQMLEKEEAAKIVKRGDAHYDNPKENSK